MKWNPFHHQGQTYDLSHVHPFDWEYTAPATDKRPERTYKLMVQFSMHTFTRGIELGEAVDPAITYRDDREERAFDFLRYALSIQLPGIIRGWVFLPKSTNRTIPVPRPPCRVQK